MTTKKKPNGHYDLWEIVKHYRYAIIYISIVVTVTLILSYLDYRAGV